MDDIQKRVDEFYEWFVNAPDEMIDRYNDIESERILETKILLFDVFEKAEELTEQNKKLVDALKAIEVADGDIGTTIYKSELERCQLTAKYALQELNKE